MATQEEVTYHRTFLSEYRCNTVFDETRRYENPSQYPNGVPRRKERLASDAVYRAHVQHCGRAGVGYSMHAGRTHSAYIMQGNNLAPLVLREKADQRFVEFATLWEQTYSSLSPVAFHSVQFKPIVDDQLAVVGHTGSMQGNNFADLIVPSNAPASLWRQDGVPMFVHDRRMKPPPGWRIHSHGHATDSSFSVITSIDGEVLRITHKGDRGPEAPSVDPGDLLAIGTLLASVGRSVGNQLAKSLWRKSTANSEARRLLNGPTEELAKKTAKAAEPISRGPGAKQNKWLYKPSPKHGPGGWGSRAPKNREPGALLANSEEVGKGHRIAYDNLHKEVIVFRKESNVPGRAGPEGPWEYYHGYVVEWAKLRADEKAVLHRARIIHAKTGRLLKEAD